MIFKKFIKKLCSDKKNHFRVDSKKEMFEPRHHQIPQEHIDLQMGLQKHDQRYHKYECDSPHPIHL